MSQISANELNRSDSRSDQSDSMVNESLAKHDYNFNCPKQIESSEMSDSNESGCSNSNNNFFSKHIDQIKSAFMQEREQIIKGIAFQKKIVINKLPQKDQNNKNLQSKTQELKNLLQNQQDDKQEKRRLQFETQQLDNELRLLEQINDFKQRIMNSLQQKKPILKSGQPSTDIKARVLSKLQQRSKVILQKLRPYLQEHLKINKAKNKQIQELHEKLEKDTTAYTQEINRLQQEIHQHQSITVIYDLQDQINNQIKYKNQLDKYISRNDSDIKFRKSKNL